MTRDLWRDGLEEHAFAAVREACDQGIPEAEAALVDLEQNAGKSSTARAIVRRLAAELSRRVHMDMRLRAAARDRLRQAPPELN